MRKATATILFLMLLLTGCSTSKPMFPGLNSQVVGNTLAMAVLLFVIYIFYQAAATLPLVKKVLKWVAIIIMILWGVIIAMSFGGSKAEEYVIENVTVLQSFDFQLHNVSDNTDTIEGKYIVKAVSQKVTPGLRSYNVAEGFAVIFLNPGDEKVSAKIVSSDDSHYLMVEVMGQDGQVRLYATDTDMRNNDIPNGMFANVFPQITECVPNQDTFEGQTCQNGEAVIFMKK